jgi:hypothetical protein
MNTNRINIKKIGLLILLIAISITIGLSIAKASVLHSHADLKVGHELNLRASVLLRGDLQARPTSAELLGGAALKGLDLKVEDSDSLDALGGRLLG